MINRKNPSHLQQVIFARRSLEKQRTYRCDKIWTIFIWTGSLLTTITGGAVSLKINPPSGFEFSWKLRVILISSVICLMAHALSQIRKTLILIKKMEKFINECDKKLGIKPETPELPHQSGYMIALIILTLAAITAIFYR